MVDARRWRNRRVIRSLVLAFVFAAPLAIAPEAIAQETGGSFGGGSWGGGGGGGSSSSSSSSWRSSSSSDYGSSSSGGEGSGLGTAVCVVIGLVLVWGSIALVGTLRDRARARRAARHNDGHPVVTPPAGSVDVSSISLAIDWRSRAQLQKRLVELARTGDTKTAGGLASLLHETIAELRRVEHSWLYAGAVNAAPTNPGPAQQLFLSITNEMRSRFKREIVRAHGGSVRTDEPGVLRAKRDEGQGVVVVTLVVAARGEIPDIARAQDANHLRQLMRALGAVGAQQLVALEVIWSPAAEDDRMSTVELEAIYPELRKIDEASIAGRTFCAHCSSPYPAELLECAHCGAPSPPRGPGGAPHPAT